MVNTNKINKNKILSKFALIGLILILSSFFVIAAPGIPNQFFGTVTVNGEVAPDNLFVQARINNGVFTTITNNGRYGYDPIFYIEDQSNDRQGQTIRFYVGTSSNNMVEAQSRTFSNGAVLRHDLTVTGLTIPSTGGGTTSGGTTGGGVSGGGMSNIDADSGVSQTSNDDLSNELNQASSNTTTSFGNVCESNWVCSEWTECINFQQKRVCVDGNSCGLDNEPETRRSCDLSIEELNASTDENNKGFFSRITGFVTGSGNGTYATIPLIIIIGVVASAFLFLFFRKNKYGEQK